MKDSSSFHNLARELSSSTNHKPKEPKGFKYTNTRYKTHPKDFSADGNKIDGTRPGGLKKPSNRGKNRDDRTSAVITAVPDPLPDNGIKPTSAPKVIYRTSVLPLVDASTGPTAVTVMSNPPLVAQATLSSAAITFVPLPSLQVAGSATTAHPASSTVLPSTSSGSVASNIVDAKQAQSQGVHHLPTAIITLLAVGAAFTLIGLFIIIRVCSRPPKRTHPTPSLPILQDAFPDQYTKDESPIFGGKERFSGAKDDVGAFGGNATEGLWRWTQYTQRNVTKPAPIAALAKAGLNAGGAVGYGGNAGKGWLGGTGIHPAAQTKTAHKNWEEKERYPFLGHGAPATPAPLQQVQKALTRAASRLSTASMSLYPGSPLNTDVGLALDGTTSFTADGLPLISKRPPKDKNVGVMQTRSRNSTIIGHDKIRDTTCTLYSDEFAYDGADVTSPVLFQTATHVKVPAAVSNVAASGGRARIKSTYFAPGAYPRSLAAAAPSLPSSKTLGYSESKSTALNRSESRRDRETQALTSALGLTSPEMLSSPQPTIYPDDSLSVAGGDFKRSRSGKGSGRSLNQKKPAPKYPVQQEIMTPGPESSASLGSLMLVDYGATSRSIATLGREVVEGMAISGSSSGGGLAKMNVKRADDKPPRVPSPPPLPSLTQMGLQHANPEAYADYRSPTYSIYGLYEADRKSRVSSFGY